MADEPTGNLDSASSVEIMTLFRTSTGTTGITVILVTHATEMAAWTERMVTFRDGLIVDDRRRDVPAHARRQRGGRMSFMVLVRTAWKALRRNISRSLLTMLGIIIGVGAVIASMAIGAGAQAAVLKQIESLGANLIIITPGSITSGGVSLGSGARTTLTLDDVAAIAGQRARGGRGGPLFPDQRAGAGGRGELVHRDRRDHPVVAHRGQLDHGPGHLLHARRRSRVTKVAVLGSTVAANLFPAGGAVGSTIIIKSVPFRVLGVLASKGQTGFGRDQDDVVVVPITTHQERLTGQTWVNTIMISASGLGRGGGSDRCHRAPSATGAPPGPDRSPMISPSATSPTSSRCGWPPPATQALLLAAVAIVSLVVGGIGIMNIMLVSVTERTREIGLRMAVGARGRDILLQFLIEALTMACAGGVIGVGLGIGISVLVSSVAGWPTVISGFSIVLGFVSAALTGVVFGFYPARRAAALDPIDALRYE